MLEIKNSEPFLGRYLSKSVGENVCHKNTQNFHKLIYTQYILKMLKLQGLLR